MRKAHAKQLIAWLLAVLMLSGMTLPVLAGGATGTSSGESGTKSLAELSEAFNTISYEEYKSNLTEYYDLDAELVRVSGKSAEEIAALSIRQRRELVAQCVDEMNKVLRTGRSISVDVNAINTEATTATNVSFADYTDGDGVTKKAVYVPDTGITTWNVNVPADGLYALRLVYASASAKKNSIERNFYINGAIPFTEARSMVLTKTWRTHDGDLVEVDHVGGEDDPAKYAQYCRVGEDGKLYRFATDSAGNEIKPTLQATPEWKTYEFIDGDGMYTTPFEFYLKQGENTIALKGVREGMYVAAIELFTVEDLESYEDYRARVTAEKGSDKGSDKITLQAELPNAVSSYTIYPIYDRSSAISQPQHPSMIMRNAIGGDKWESAGQWIEYEIDVQNAGWYSIALRFKQATLEGLYVSRALYIDGAIPFEGASRLEFQYDSDWQVSYLGDGETAYEFYLSAGRHTIRMDVTMGNMGSIVNTVDTIQKSLNTSYLEILKLTGTEPDEYRDYGFMRVMPNTIRNLKIQKDNLQQVLDLLSGDSGLSANTTIFQRLIQLLTRMTSKETEIAKNLSELKTELGTLGEWTNSVAIQPLAVDYIMIQSADEKLPRVNANFFESLWYQLSQFVDSFFTDYNALAAGEGEGEGAAATVEVWVQSGRDQAQITRSIIQNDYQKAKVNLKLVAEGTLLAAVLSGTGPDVSLDGVKASASLYASAQPGSTAAVVTTSGDVINFAIRHAVEPLNQFTREYLDSVGETDVPSFEDVALNSGRFTDAALKPLTLYGTTYALPAKQTFPMMFVRSDILADLQQEVPKTWDDLLALLPVLQYNNMTIGLTTDYTLFLYQMGGELWADDGMRINLDSNEALAAFETMCDMFTQYSLPYSYNASNRFRTGEMPIFIAEYETFYNALVVFATEISGVWDLAPIPGTYDAEGNISNVAVAVITGVVMLRDCENKAAAWDFMTWYTDKDFQVEYSNELVAVVGPAAKNATANVQALEELDWTHDEYAALKSQMDNLVAVEAYPGSYIILRYTNFAFLKAYNDNESPTESLLAYVSSINKEITRKRKEFNLETLPAGQTLTQKRMAETSGAIEALSADLAGKLSSESKLAMKAIEDKDKDELLAAADAFAAATKTITGKSYDDVTISYEKLDGNNEPVWEITSGEEKVASDTDAYRLLMICKYLYDAVRHY